MKKFSALSWQKQVTFRWDDDDLHFVLDQQAYLDFYSASSLKQQSADRHVAPLSTDFPDFEPISLCSHSLFCIPSREASNTHFVVSDLTPQGFDLPHSMRAWWPSWISLQNNNLSYASCCKIDMYYKLFTFLSVDMEHLTP